MLIDITCDCSSDTSSPYLNIGSMQSLSDTVQAKDCTCEWNCSHVNEITNKEDTCDDSAETCSAQYIGGCKEGDPCGN